MKFMVLSEYGAIIVEGENFEDAAYFAEKRWGDNIMAIVKIPDQE